MSGPGTTQVCRPIDAHVHVGLDKYRPLEEFEADASRDGIDRAILVQHLGQYDNAYIAECVRRAPDRYAGIAMVDTASPIVNAHVDAIAADGAFAGIRLEARTRSVGTDPLRVWRAIADSGLVASVRGPIEDIIDDSFIELIGELPHLAIRLEHGAFFRHGRSTTTQLDGILQLAARPRTYLMWSGYYEFSELPYPYQDASVFLRETLAAYGPSRIMWSGDWNRNDLDPQRPHGYYGQAVAHLRDVLNTLTVDDLADVMERSAFAFLRESRTLAPGGLA